MEVEERVVLKQDKCELNKHCSVETGITGEKVIVIHRSLYHVYVSYYQKVQAFRL